MCVCPCLELLLIYLDGPLQSFAIAMDAGVDTSWVVPLTFSSCFNTDTAIASLTNLSCTTTLMLSVCDYHLASWRRLDEGEGVGGGGGGGGGGGRGERGGWSGLDVSISAGPTRY